MQPFLKDVFGNPSSIHLEGLRCKEALEEARTRIKQVCRATDFNLVFCSGGTEADNLAVVGAMLGSSSDSRQAHVIMSAVEHHAVLGTANLLKRLGGTTTVLEVDKDGRVDPSLIARYLKPGTVVVSVMTANNETGVLQDIAEIGRVLDRRAFFHTDAVQAFGKIELQLDAMPVDLVTISAHKIGGPMGAGALLVRKGVPFKPFLHGGRQERGFRAGTENVAAAVGFAQAAELAVAEREGVMKLLAQIRERIRSEITARFPGVLVNTPDSDVLPTILNVSFSGIHGEALVKLLDRLGVAASTGSACTIGGGKPSHVLRAMGRSDREAEGSLRLSLGPQNHEGEIPPFMDALVKSVQHLGNIAHADFSNAQGFETA